MTSGLPAQGSSSTESHSSAEDLSALVEQKIVNKGHIQWDCVPWVLSAIDQLEQHRKYYVDVAHRLLEHLSKESTLLELSKQQPKPDKGKGKKQPEGHSPNQASDDPRAKLNKAAWDKVREVAASELNDLRLYWGASSVFVYVVIMMLTLLVVPLQPWSLLCAKCTSCMS